MEECNRFTFGMASLPRILLNKEMDFALSEMSPMASVMQSFGQANLSGKAIVILLLLLSLLAWSVMLGKYLELRKFQRQNALVSNRLEATERVVIIDPKLPGASGPFGHLGREALSAYHRSMGGEHSMGQVENALQRAVARAVVQYESRMVLLGSIVSGAPFLGLLGTVWGVMDAFGAIAGQEGASIATLAPGVSGALLTTVAGLLVAIPSVFGYNYLLTEVKREVTEMENFASHLADRIELEDKES